MEKVRKPIREPWIDPETWPVIGAIIFLLVVGGIAILLLWHLGHSLPPVESRGIN